MRTTPRLFPLAAGLILAASLSKPIQAQSFVTPLENRQDEVRLNLQSYRGLPLSTTAGDPAGSDGRAPTQAQQQTDGLTILPPTTGQFQGSVSLSAVIRPTAPAQLVSGRNLSQNAESIGLPRTPATGKPAAVLVSAQVGASIFGRPITFLFGAVIPPPDTDVDGTVLPDEILPENYWLAEPHSATDHDNAGYYWSPHASEVFAAQAGPIEVVWKRAQPFTEEPADYNANPGNYSVEGGNYYPLLPVRYFVSGSAIKTPRRMYWTEGVFQDSGKPISVPPARIGAVYFVYNNNFPKRVESEFQAPGQSTVVEENRLEETRTIWFDHTRRQILAYNHEGRILMELLGDAGDGETRQHLGFEVIDVRRQANPFDVQTDLGERLTAFQDKRDDSHLTPEPVNQLSGQSYIFQANFDGSERVDIYAVRETFNLNDVLVFWMEEGIEGLLWPSRLVRYDQTWPVDIAKYSHYVRPLAGTEDEARETAVPLPNNNVPFIQYQDPLDRPRAKITEETEFFTYLDPGQPVHRTLLRFSSGDQVRFERVFSWLNSNLRSGEFTGTLATTLTAWDSETETLVLDDTFVSPRVVERIAPVGQRIKAPDGEIGASANESFLAGYIRQSQGTLFSPSAYIDPFINGFEEANQGAIIPINTIPNKNILEIWWFRENDANTQLGFETILWPSVIGRYTIEWPSNPPEIVMASNDGSGALTSLESRGVIYYQNDPAITGYNPNEEHAVIIGGQVFALRDDLNVVEGANYSSAPYVLLEYEAADQRPAMTVFKVLREKPEEGIVFDYVVEAGSQLQAPMPLPLLPLPVEGSGDNAVNYNTEPQSQSGDVPINWDAQTHGAAGSRFSHYDQFTFEDRKHIFWVYRGQHDGLPILEMGSYNDDTEAFDALAAATAVVDQDFTYHIHASRRDVSLVLSEDAENPLPGWLSIDGLSITGRPGEDDEGDVTIGLVLIDVGDNSEATATLELTIAADGSVVTQEALAITSFNTFSQADVTYPGRPPHLATAATGANSFRMRFYYRTQPGFAWPGLASPPAVDTIVPYLRPIGDAGGFTGNPASKSTPSLDIVYRPVWPAIPPSLSFGDTLTTPKAGLPAVRGQTSMQVLYQQSIAADISVQDVSALLHDATREKSVDIGALGMDILPPSVHTYSFQGKIYFPNLPPHLVDRFFFDPNRSEAGHLVFKGEFRDEAFGSDFLLLNVLRQTSEGDDGADLAVVKALTPSTDTQNKAKWDAAIDALATTVETFYENPNVPGTYIANPALDEVVGIGELAVVEDSNTAVDSYALSASGPGQGYVTLIAGDGEAFTPPGEPVSVYVIRVTAPMASGEIKVLPSPNPLSELITMQHSLDVGGEFHDFEYEWMIAPPVDGLPPAISETMSGWTLFDQGNGIPFITLGGSGIQVLIDNYFVMRYRPTNAAHPLTGEWSDWTSPQLAEGWIKRVLAGINPFNQRVTDLFNNAINTDVSLLTQAGSRWEGDVALNLENINDFGLIEIYETVLRRGKLLSIEAGINFGPANDALLLAAGYINDLYMMLGNEALADASNPTIGISTADGQFGDAATALFAFKGQSASLLEEELALLRGRDDFLLPGVEIAPVYNRLVWNYTRGIDAGEVIYAINYNVQEDPNKEPDGIINAEDAQIMFPQGHGDAYGHYLTALKGYYSLLTDSEFTWAPRIEAVLVLGQPVSVDYLDERKFASAAASVARAGKQVFDLTWRQSYAADNGVRWENFTKTRENAQRDVTTTRFWGLDHWAARVGQGSYLNWVVGNAMLPDVDPDPTHEGIQKIDRSTVVELAELPSIFESLQTSMDNAEGGLNPLGMPEESVPFDISPSQLAGDLALTHFEQIHDRAKQALRNAVTAFDEAKDVTRLMRSEQDSLADLRNTIAEQELAFETALIEVYGTPYPDDIGPGRTYASGYEGPDLIHYTYVDRPQRTFTGLVEPSQSKTFQIDIQNFVPAFSEGVTETFDFIAPASQGTNGQDYVTFHFSPDEYFGKPSTWSGRRASPGKIQQGISEIIQANSRVLGALEDSATAKAELDGAIALFKSKIAIRSEILDLSEEQKQLLSQIASVESANEAAQDFFDSAKQDVRDAVAAAAAAMPESTIVGFSNGGDLTAPGRSVLKKAQVTILKIIDKTAIVRSALAAALSLRNNRLVHDIEYNLIPTLELREEAQHDAHQLAILLRDVQGHLLTINARLQELDDAERALRRLIAEGNSIQRERQIFRQRAAALVQGFRTRDAAFRIFRNEKLERYKTLFDLAATYTYLAAKAFDYETGLLHTDEGQAFLQRIVSARALGIVRDGEPQFAGSNTGDPGLSSVLAEMTSDWNVLKGRLGFNNPDDSGTTVSLRTEHFRILPGAEGDLAWRDILEGAIRDDLLADEDVRRYCMQINSGDGLPVPGLILDFSTVIADGRNLFGKPLAPGDHGFSPSAFATKIYAAGVAMEGYTGMDDPSANTAAIQFAGASSPANPSVSFLDPNALAATPYVYLVPVGVDSMRSPPLGDSSVVRTWSVADVTVPMPFNVGGSDFSSKRLFQSSDSLTETLYGIRKHQAFRPVSTATAFNQNIYGGTGGLLPSPFTNSRLIGRSVWNSQWKLVIPGRTLLNNPKEGLDRFARTVTDIKLHFVTYSYSGN